MLKRIAIVGVGLIGASVALALKKANAVETIVGIDSDPVSLQQAAACNAIDISGTITDIGNADVILLAIPVRQIAKTLAGLLPNLGANTIVIDTGSTKQDVTAAAIAALGSRVRQFVPCHPIAGGEIHGPLAADAELFVGKNVVITPLAENSLKTIQEVREIWQTTGANIVEMSAATHDEVFAAVSHLPHLLAFVLVDELASRQNARMLFEHAASGFRDFTRIAGSSPEMWRDVAINNRAALMVELDAFLKSATRLRDLVGDSNEQEIFAMMRRAQEARAHWLAGNLDQFNDKSA